MSRPAFGGVDLPRPAPAPDEGLGDEPFYDLVEANFRRLVEANPILATYVGIHAWDDHLPDGSRERVLAELEGDVSTPYVNGRLGQLIWLSCFGGKRDDRLAQGIELCT